MQKRKPIKVPSSLELPNSILFAYIIYLKPLVVRKARLQCGYLCMCAGAEVLVIHLYLYVMRVALRSLMKLIRKDFCFFATRIFLSYLACGTKWASFAHACVGVDQRIIVGILEVMKHTVGKFRELESYSREAPIDLKSYWNCHMSTNFVLSCS